MTVKPYRRLGEKVSQIFDMHVAWRGKMKRVVRIEIPPRPHLLPLSLKLQKEPNT
jgi:hypothetical protein